MMDDSHASAGSLPPPPLSPLPPSSSPSNRQDPSQTTTEEAADDTALQEAAAVLEAIGGESHLDGFNLLGVIANPRGSMLALAPPSSSSFHGRYNQSSSSTTGAAAGGASSSSPVHHTTTGGGVGYSSSSDNNNGVLSETYHTLELTLSSVTEQVEALNMVLEDWSRQLLEDSYPSYEDQLPDALLKELPLELQHLQLQSLQTYLEGSGESAHSFDQRRRRRRLENDNDNDAVSRIERAEALARKRTHGSDHTGNADEDGGDSHHDQDDDGLAAIMAEVEREIPARFFDDAFDLTDPDTFRELLLLDTTDPRQSDTKDRPSNGGNGPIQEWFPLPPQDTFGSFLDKVELALLQQVRSKSDAFFEESLRFAQLQEWIESLLTQVVELQTVVQGLQRDLLHPLELVPTADAHRSVLHELLHVLEAAEDLLHCKGSVGGYLSAQEDLAAIDQIQYGRSLLDGRDDDTNNNSRPQPLPGRDAGRQPRIVELRRLRALESVADQLNQYEHLVVTNLREELVEVFLEWNSSTVSSLYAGNGHSSSASKSSQQVRQRVREIAGALQRCRGLTKTRETYGNRLHEVIRMTVRTIVSEFASDAALSSSSVGGSTVTVSGGATAMSLDRFVACLDMLFEQLLSMITAASGVNAFCVAEHLTLHDDDDNNNNGGNDPESAATDPPPAIHPTAAPPAASTPLASIILSAGDLSSKSVSELLRLRREAHSLITLDEMKRIWDKCLSFTSELEELSGHKASALRSTLLAQAKAFLERKHESNMSALAAALDSERWTQCDVSPERQSSLARLCSGRSVALTSLSRDADDHVDASPKAPEVEIEGKRYKVVWSCLLLMEMCMADLAAASHFPGLASSIVAKVAELLRLFNTRTTQLVLGAGAIHSTARLKSINAKHLSLVTQCLRLVSCTLPYVRAGIMAQLPPKQHALLSVFDQIKKEYADHNEMILNKFVTIIGGIVEHGLAPKIRGTDFDARSKIPPLPDGKVACCIFLEGISTNTRKMHQVLASLLPPDHLQDVFSRIFAFVDQKVPDLFRAVAAESPPPNAPAAAVFSFPKTDDGKRRLLSEVDVMTTNLNGLDGVRPWEFTLTSILGKLLEIRVDATDPPTVGQESEGNGNADSDTNADGKMKASDRDPHSSEVVSENGTEISTETLQTEDTILTTDEHNNGDPMNSTEAKTEAVLKNDGPDLELAIPGAKDEQAEIPPSH